MIKTKTQGLGLILTRQGVRDLDAMMRRGPLPASIPLGPGTDVKAEWDEPTTVIDVLYDRCQELWEEIRSVWPDAKLRSADHWIKGERTSVEISGCSRKTWYKWLVRSGWAQLSLSFQLSMYQEIDLIKAVV